MGGTRLVVRRGLSSSYYFYLSVFAEHDGVEVIIDRRSGDRRTGSRAQVPERRRADRRRPSPDVDPDCDLLCVVDDCRPSAR